MTEKKLTVSYQQFDTDSHLSAIQQTLLTKARIIVQHAYNPYSNFSVGCAVLLTNGEMVAGFNIENAAYSACICAERTALSAAITQYASEKIAALAISYMYPNGHSNVPAFPCGECRQFIAEVEDRNQQNIPILLSGLEGEVLLFETIQHLLPFSFTKKSLLP